MNKKFTYLIAIVLFAGLSCKERYYPQFESSEKGYLVVEGVLNAGAEATIIDISRTYPVNTNDKRVLEENAIVTVEGNDNSARPLSMISPGKYYSENLNLSQSGAYRLRIKTTAGKEYLSDYTKVKVTPPIDSIGFKRKDDGVELYVNAHDPANNTIYYRWNFDETWEINSLYQSVLMYDKELPFPIRDRIFPDEQILRCWKNDISKSLLFASSAKLTSDIIHENPIHFIPNGSEKLTVLYSILVRQYSMDKKAYEFFDLMKKNTESIGTIFDPQPSEIRGNIKCISDPNEIVIGFISATTVTQKRFFIKRPAGWVYSQACETRIVPPDSLDFYFGNGLLIPIVESPREGSIILDYLGGTSVCVDCRTRAGRTEKPLFWPN